MKEFDYSIDKTAFLSKSNFSEYIENMVLETPEMTYFEAILKFSEQSDKEPEELLQFMSTVLLSKIRQSAIESDLIKADTYSLDDLV